MKKILFLMQLPPPVHGVSMVNVSIRDSHYINAKIIGEYVNISPARELSDLGKLTIGKMISTIIIFFKCVFKYIRFKPDVVYLTLSPRGFAFWKDALILQMLKVLGAKTVIHLHGKGMSVEVIKSKMKQRLYKFFFKGVNDIHLSKSLFSDIETILDNNMSLIEVNNGVENKRANERLPSEFPTFLYLSNYVPTKGADTFIEAVNLLDDKYIGRFKVKLVGKISNQKFYSELVNKVEKRFTDFIDFSGPIYGDKKFEVFNNSDVFVLPSKNECFPLTILEAMSSGLPVLSTFEGAIPDIIDDGINGRIFESNDPGALAAILAQYIDNPSLIASHGANAISKYKEKYTLEIFEKRLLTTLMQLIDERNSDML